jgi:hypothetical protein
VLKREAGKYHVIRTLPDSSFEANKAAARRHIEAVVKNFLDFTVANEFPIRSESDAIGALLGFLNEFSIDCLRYYLRGTALPEVDANDNNLVIVSRFIEMLAERLPERFESFIILVKGHMLANALLCPDLGSLPKSFRKVVFYLDTPIVIRALGLEGSARQEAATELLHLLRKLGGRIAVFSHTLDEIKKVIKGAADHIDSPTARGQIIVEMRQQKRTRSDLYLIAEELDTRLAVNQVEEHQTPKYSLPYQIDELAFEEELTDEVHYYNPRASEYDVNSVRSIYAIREGTSPRSLENARAVFVTTNGGFARAAFRYGRDIEETRSVSSVVTDFSVANLAWLKAPMGAPDLPAKEIMAYCYAALQPSQHLWDKYLSEGDKLLSQGSITPETHQLLRYKLRARDELMNLTLGDASVVSPEMMVEIVERVEASIRSGDIKRLKKEKEDHKQARVDLQETAGKLEQTKKRIFWLCRRIASVASLAIALIILASIVIFGTIAINALFNPEPFWIKLVSPIGLLILIGGIFTLVNAVLGLSVLTVFERVRDWIQPKLAKSVLKMLGLGNATS